MSLVIEVLRNAHELSHAALLVLLAITAYVEEHGAPAYPSQATIAHDSGVTERYIEACVQECETAGYLHVERRREPGKRPRNFYTVLYRWRTIPEQASGNQVPRTGFPEAPSVEKQERKKDLQEHAVQGNPVPRTLFPEPGSGIGRGASTLAQHGRTQAEISPKSVQGVDDRHRQPHAPRPPGNPPSTSRASSVRVGHDDGTGHTLRRVKNGNCTECDVARTRAKRQAQAAVARPPRQAGQAGDRSGRAPPAQEG